MRQANRRLSLGKTFVIALIVLGLMLCAGMGMRRREAAREAVYQGATWVWQPFAQERVFA